MLFLSDVLSVFSICVYWVLVQLMVIYVMFFFFQAEDGIRDLVRSRGLGDVYKRQGDGFAIAAEGGLLHPPIVACQDSLQFPGSGIPQAVSYTHLTLPTIYSV